MWRQSSRYPLLASSSRVRTPGHAPRRNSRGRRPRLRTRLGPFHCHCHVRASVVDRVRKMFRAVDRAAVIRVHRTEIVRYHEIRGHGLVARDGPRRIDRRGKETASSLPDSVPFPSEIEHCRRRFVPSDRASSIRSNCSGSPSWRARVRYLRERQRISEDRVTRRPANSSRRSFCRSSSRLRVRFARGADSMLRRTPVPARVRPRRDSPQFPEPAMKVPCVPSGRWISLRIGVCGL